MGSTSMPEPGGGTQSPFPRAKFSRVRECEQNVDGAPLDLGWHAFPRIHAACAALSAK